MGREGSRDSNGEGGEHVLVQAHTGPYNVLCEQGFKWGGREAGIQMGREGSMC